MYLCESKCTPAAALAETADHVAWQASPGVRLAVVNALDAGAATANAFPL